MNENIKTTLLVACNKEGIIAQDGKIPWHYKEDLQNFKQKTLGGVVIVGRKTWESIPGYLKGRQVIVLTKNQNKKIPINSHEASNLQEAIKCAQDLIKSSFRNLVPLPDESVYNTCVWKKEIFIIGGTEIYDQFLREYDFYNLRYCEVTVVPDKVELKGKIDYFPLPLLKQNFVQIASNITADGLDRQLWQAKPIDMTLSDLEVYNYYNKNNLAHPLNFDMWKIK